jgi:hypothetical protein
VIEQIYAPGPTAPALTGEPARPERRWPAWEAAEFDPRRL